MFLWDSNILRHFGEGHPILQFHLQRVSWSEIALPSVVVAEVLRGRSDFALKAEPSQASLAHARLMQTLKSLEQFNIVVFDDECSQTLTKLQQTHKAHKRYADLLIAAMALAGNHVMVTRNQKDFVDLLPPDRLANWIDDKPA